MAEPNEPIKLPNPELSSEQSVEMLLQQRRSVRSYKKSSLNLTEVGQLLWSAQGVSDAQGLRTAPSAGALYPLKLFVVVGDVNELSPGIYQYNPEEHSLLKTAMGIYENWCRKQRLISPLLVMLPLYLCLLQFISVLPGSMVIGACVMCIWKWAMQARIFFCKLKHWILERWWLVHSMMMK